LPETSAEEEGAREAVEGRRIRFVARTRSHLSLILIHHHGPVSPAPHESVGVGLSLYLSCLWLLFSAVLRPVSVCVGLWCRRREEEEEDEEDIIVPGVQRDDGLVGAPLTRPSLVCDHTHLSVSDPG